MDKAAGLIRLMLASMFLLAFALSIVPASANACPNTRLVSGTTALSRDVASLETVAATMTVTAALNAHRHGHHGSTPDCCALGLCGSPAAAVLPAAGLISPASNRQDASGFFTGSGDLLANSAVGNSPAGVLRCARRLI